MLAEQSFMSVKEVAKFLDIKESTIYGWICNIGVNNGKKRKGMPKVLFIKLGRKKVLFKRKELLEWLYAGAELVYQ